MQFCECATSKSVLDFSSSSKISSHRLSCSALRKYCWAGPPEAAWVNEHCDVKAQICMPVPAASWLASHLISLCPFFGPGWLGLLKKCYLLSFLYSIQHPCALSDTPGICVGIYVPSLHSFRIWILHIWACLTPASPTIVNQDNLCVQEDSAIGLKLPEEMWQSQKLGLGHPKHLISLSLLKQTFLSVNQLTVERTVQSMPKQWAWNNFHYRFIRKYSISVL